MGRVDTDKEGVDRTLSYKRKDEEAKGVQEWTWE
jgi:hypothetical protein